MSNGRKRMTGAFAAALLIAAGAPIAAPVSAQTGAESEEDFGPYGCSIRKDYYSCCRPYDPCTQIFIDAPLPPPEPAEPAEPPKN